jgi:hypothetical protein
MKRAAVVAVGRRVNETSDAKVSSPKKSMRRCKKGEGARVDLDQSESKEMRFGVNAK